MYAERPSRFPGAVLWTTTGGESGEARVLPDGCMDLLWYGGALVIAGPDTTAHVGPVPVGRALAGLRFAPGTAPTVLGLPAVEVRDRRVRLDAVWDGADVRRLTERVAEAAHPGRVLEEIAVDRMRAADPPPPELVAMVRGLDAGRSVAAVADATGLSARQLHRRALAAFGYGPKTLARILRLQRALALARDGVPFAETAVRTGYADQAHLARDVRALTGTSLGRLVG